MNFTEQFKKDPHFWTLQPAFRKGYKESRLRSAVKIKQLQARDLPQEGSLVCDGCGEPVGHFKCKRDKVTFQMTQDVATIQTTTHAVVVVCSRDCVAEARKNYSTVSMFPWMDKFQQLLVNPKDSEEKPTSR